MSGHLTFGTGGLRGVLGAGMDRMNLDTVAIATRGLADYLIESGGGSVCIAYDTRNLSTEFAEKAAGVLAAAGIKVYIFSGVRPTPMLSFAVRDKGAAAGIVITASHNPPEYNGYKVYGPDGGQITDAAADAISAYMGRYETAEDIVCLRTCDAREHGMLEYMDDVDAVYYAKVTDLSIRKEMLAQHGSELRILYSPLHGAGNIPVRHVLGALGFAGLRLVAEQTEPDGDFPTVAVPNPEESSVYELAKKLAAETKPDIIFATDPDCDRIGVLAGTGDGEYHLFNGNEIGALLCEYILSSRKELGGLGANPAIIKTIVTTELARAICTKNEIDLVETLTGFKYIGEKIGEWEKTRAHTFLFGFEESYGYLAGDFVRDKDAVIAAVLISEMALFHKLRGKTLVDAFGELNERYGYTKEILISRTMKGLEGMAQIAEIMSRFREDYRMLLAGEKILLASDYESSVEKNVITGEEAAIVLPKSNVLRFTFEDGSWLACRPSGTEPKIKFYIGANGASQAEADLRADGLAGKIEGITK
ncbi:phosphomannomutase [Clostridia bacterium]|nr:phosphomannomutase [Clostridia bacterium]